MKWLLSQPTALLLAVVFAGIGYWLLRRSLRWLGRVKRRECPACGYPVATGRDVSICSECGQCTTIPEHYRDAARIGVVVGCILVALALLPWISLPLQTVLLANAMAMTLVYVGEPWLVPNRGGPPRWKQACSRGRLAAVTIVAIVLAPIGFGCIRLLRLHIASERLAVHRTTSTPRYKSENSALGEPLNAYLNIALPYAWAAALRPSTLTATIEMPSNLNAIEGSPVSELEIRGDVPLERLERFPSVTSVAFYGRHISRTDVDELLTLPNVKEVRFWSSTLAPEDALVLARPDSLQLTYVDVGLGWQRDVFEKFQSDLTAMRRAALDQRTNASRSLLAP